MMVLHMKYYRIEKNGRGPYSNNRIYDTYLSEHNNSPKHLLPTDELQLNSNYNRLTICWLVTNCHFKFFFKTKKQMKRWFNKKLLKLLMLEGYIINQYTIDDRYLKNKKFITHIDFEYQSMIHPKIIKNAIVQEIKL